MGVFRVLCAAAVAIAIAAAPAACADRARTRAHLTATAIGAAGGALLFGMPLSADCTNSGEDRCPVAATYAISIAAGALAANVLARALDDPPARRGEPRDAGARPAVAVAAPPDPARTYPPPRTWAPRFALRGASPPYPRPGDRADLPTLGGTWRDDGVMAACATAKRAARDALEAMCAREVGGGIASHTWGGDGCACTEHYVAPHYECATWSHATCTGGAEPHVVLGVGRGGGRADAEREAVDDAHARCVLAGGAPGRIAAACTCDREVKAPTFTCACVAETTCAPP